MITISSSSSGSSSGSSSSIVVAAATLLLVLLTILDPPDLLALPVAVEKDDDGLRLGGAISYNVYHKIT